jgi:Tfp pilus assembly protein PilF
MDAAAHAFEAINASDKVSDAEKLQMIESVAGGYYRAKQYAQAIQWYQRYFKQGGRRAANRTLLIQAQYLSGDFASVSRELMAEIRATEKRGRTPHEDRIELLRSAAVQQKDRAAETFALERLVRHYPKKEYWATLLARLQRQPGFSDRLALDVYRLALATGSMSSASDYVEMTQLALQAGSSAEARQVIDQGFASGVLGSGPQAARHKRLRALVLKQVAESKKSRASDEKQALAAKDGNDLLAVGMNLVYGGDPASGVRLMQQGLAKGGLKRPEDALLHLGLAQLAAGDAAKAQATLSTVSGADGTQALARLWALHAKNAKRS